MYKLVLGIAAGLLLFSSPTMAACSVSYTFATGTTAVASQVNTNFSDLYTCAAPLASPSFTGSVGIGMTATNILDITQNQNGTSQIKLLNNSGGTAVQAKFAASNGTHEGALVIFGTGFTTSGVFRQDGMYLGGDGVGGLTLNTQAVQPIYFGISNAEAARFGTDGSFLVGTTTNGGWATNAKLAVVSSINAATFHNTGSSGWAGSFRVDSTAVTVVDFRFGATNVGSVSTNGSRVFYNETSDERLKDWKIAQRSYSEVIRKLWVGDFKWKKDGIPDFGYRAQQAYLLFPEAVRKPSDAMGMWQMDYGKTAALAMWGVKDLYKATDDQSRSVSALQMEVKRLRVQTIALQQVHANDAAKLERLEHLVISMRRAPVVQAALK
ncbi:MAG TPA: hypothetical protein VJ750_10615 [Rhizomicrobium sp.]|nr:hypothetical protein [Rhizomicrobium sp.]